MRFIAAALIMAVVMLYTALQHDRAYDIPYLNCPKITAGESIGYYIGGFIPDCFQPPISRHDESSIQTCEKQISAPLNEHYFGDNDILSWTANALPQIMSFERSNYLEQFQRSELYFTAKGWGSFSQAIEKSGMLDRLNATEGKITLTLLDNPVVTSKSVQAGLAQWDIQVLATQKYESDLSDPEANDFSVYISVVRSPCAENLNGFGIRQIIMTPR